MNASRLLSNAVIALALLAGASCARIAVPAPAAPRPEAQAPKAAAPSDLRFVEVSSHTIAATWSANGNPQRALYQADIWAEGAEPTSLILLSNAAYFEDLSTSTVYHVRVLASVGDGIPSESIMLSTMTPPWPVPAKPHAGHAVAHVQVPPPPPPPAPAAELSVTVLAGAQGTVQPADAATAAPSALASQKPKAKRKAPATPEPGRYWVQVRAYRQAQNADTFAKTVTAKHPEAKVFFTKVEGVDYHRVRIGPFDTPADAKAAAVQLAAEGHEIWVAGD